MDNNNNILASIFKICETKNIDLDKKAFSFRLITHPMYPNILSIVETLEYFNIDYGAYQVDFDEIGLTPNDSLVFLKKGKQQDLHYLTRKNDNYYIDSRKVFLSNLKNFWQGTVLAIEENKTKTTFKFSQKNILIMVLMYVVLGLSTFLYKNLYSFSFLFFPIVGALLSLVVLKNIFKIDVGVFDKLCKATSKTNCEKITNSQNLFTKKINFSDIAISFFFIQLITYIVMGSLDLELEYFSIQKVLLIGSFPFILLSIYIQKIIEKTWCPICLGIITVLILEFSFITLLVKPEFSFTFHALHLFSTIALMVIISWFYLKKFLLEINETKKNEIRLTKLFRNYGTFKNTLLQKERYNLPKYVTKKLDKKLDITLVTDPFCEHCSDVHEVLKDILKNYKEDINLNYMLKIDIDDETGKDKELCRNLAALQLTNNNDKVSKALSKWFKHKNVAKWLKNHTQKFDNKEVDTFLIQQSDWCIKNNLNFTPILFINGYLYPIKYDIKDLDYFIQNILEDESFVAVS